MKMNSEIMNNFNTRMEEMASGDGHKIEDLEISPSLLMLLPDPDVEPNIPRQFVSLEIEELSSEDDMSKRQCKKFYPLESLNKKIEISKDTKNKIIKNSRSYDQLLGSKEKITMMDFKKISKLISCHMCQTMPITSCLIYTCSQGHQVCAHCYERGQVECGICNQPLDFHNEVLESTLQNLKETYPELFFQEAITKMNNDGLEVNESKRLIQVSSHKPLICPHLDCQRVIAFSGFRSHFLYDHSEVPVISLVPVIPYRFVLLEMFLENSAPRVVSVLMVESNSETGGIRLGTPLICCIMSIALEFCGIRSLALWCSCLYKGECPPFSYTLMAPRSRGYITYRGSISSMHEDPQDILEDGRCLFLSPGILKSLYSQNEPENFIQIQLEVIK